MFFPLVCIRFGCHKIFTDEEFFLTFFPSPLSGCNLQHLKDWLSMCNFSSSLHLTYPRLSPRHDFEATPSPISLKGNVHFVEVYVA